MPPFCPHYLEATPPRKLRPPGTEEEAPDDVALQEPPDAEDTLLEAFDEADIVEEAEQLLRVAAPHDYDLIVIGGGVGGCACALRAAQYGRRVALITPDALGGSLGHITLATALQFARAHDRSQPFRWTALRTACDKQCHLERERLAAEIAERNVTVVQGRARFLDAHRLEVTEVTGAARCLAAVDVVIATGSHSVELDIPAVDTPRLMTADAVVAGWPEAARVVVTGGGPVAVELAWFYHAAGARVTVLEPLGRLLPREDADLGHELAKRFENYGITVHTGYTPRRLEGLTSGLTLVADGSNGEIETEADLVIAAGGRRAATGDLALEAVGIAHDDGRILVDLQGETNVSGVYAVGDCIRHSGWAHQAEGEGRMVAEIIVGEPTVYDPTLAPSCYWCHPPVAAVGASLAVALRDVLAATEHYFSLDEHDEVGGFIKLVVEHGSGELLGCQALGTQAMAIVNGAVGALAARQRVPALAALPFPHGTAGALLAAAARAVAKAWP